MPPKSGKEVGDPFAGLDGSSSAAEDAASLHGTQLGAVQSIRVTRIPIYDIQPDPLQPRRIIPNELREQFHGDAQTFLREWIAASEIEPLDYFGEEFEIPVYEKPIQTSLQQVLLLARSIRDTGLTNPVTVIRAGRSNYTLETGERRWFAFQLLNVLFGEEFNDIPARVMNERSVWRQASENNQRDDLNAIAKARQYALLVMDVLASDGEKTEPIENFSNELEFYAQVKEARVPRGFGDKIQNAMGFAGRMSVHRHRELLGLPYEIWKLADDYNTPESVLRQMFDKDEAKPLDVQLAIFEAWMKVRGKEQDVTIGYKLDADGNVSIGYNSHDEQNVTNGNNSDENVTSGYNSAVDTAIKNFNKSSKQISQLFLIDTQGLAKKKRDEYRQTIKKLRSMLDTLEERLND